jgi:hypothetical protein
MESARISRRAQQCKSLRSAYIIEVEVIAVLPKARGDWQRGKSKAPNWRRRSKLYQVSIAALTLMATLCAFVGGAPANGSFLYPDSLKSR